MTAEELYNVIISLLRKDSRGKTLNRDEFNDLCPVVNMEVSHDLLKKFEKGQLSTDSVAIFKKINETQTFTNGIGELPSDYFHLIGEPRYNYSEITGYSWDYNDDPSYAEGNVSESDGSYFKGFSTEGDVINAQIISDSISVTKDLGYRLSFDVDDYDRIEVGTLKIGYTLGGEDYSLTKDDDWVIGSTYNYYFTPSSTGNIIVYIEYTPDDLPITGTIEFTSELTCWPESWRRIDVVTNPELTQRLTDQLTVPTAKYPIVLIGEENEYLTPNIFIWPEAIKSIIIDYLRKPLNPFLDYYVNNTTYVITNMKEDETVNIGAGYTYRDGSVAPGATASITVDPEYDDEEMVLFVYLMLQKLGVQIGDMNVIQTAIAKEAQNG